MKRSFDGLLAVLGLGVSLLGMVACDHRSADLSEWTVADHDHQVETKRRPAGTPRTYVAPSERNQLIDVTWIKQCSNCHGKRGRGDGPQSPMVKARDLTKADWQASVTDESIAKVIREGRQKMPAFNLPDSIVQGLVGHVRGMIEKPKETARDEAAPVQTTATTAPASAGDSPRAAPAPGTRSPAPASTSPEAVKTPAPKSGASPDRAAPRP
jgi:mono/diheme cytochrome c family protein